MYEIEIAEARLNLQISINRLLIRSKLTDISNEKRDNILREAKDIENALELIKKLSKHNAEVYKIMNRVYLENLRLKKDIEELTKVEHENI